MPLSQQKNKALGGKLKDDVWEHFNSIDIPNSSHKSAQCKFCNQTWKWGKSSDMKAHLALKCSMITYDVKLEYLHIIKSDDILESTNKRQKLDDKNSLYNYFDSNKIDETKILRIYKALVRFFVCCGIPFSVVESPFFQDFTKSLCYGYELPKWSALSNQLLDTETANITIKIEEELRQAKNLTLGKNFIILFYLICQELKNI